MRYTARRQVAATVIVAGFLMLVGGLLADVLLEKRTLALYLGGAGCLVMLACGLINRRILQRRAVGARQRNDW
jgi:drug/metabolite transporter (DMT)-like permease